jgi:hypothetical protein
MLHLPVLVAFALLFTVTFGSPRPRPAPIDDAIVTITETSTAIITASAVAPESTNVSTPTPESSTSTTGSSDDASLAPSSTWPASTSTTYPQTVPTSWFTVSAARYGSEIHLLPMSAAGLRFYLGGNTVSYCPDSVMNSTIGCPPGNTTVMSLCSMVRPECFEVLVSSLMMAGCGSSRWPTNLCYSWRRDWLHSGT